MDDRTKAADLAVVAPGKSGTKTGLERKTGLFRRFPTIAHLRRHAPRHAPRFAFEYMDGGAGEDTGIRRNWAALDAIELAARIAPDVLWFQLYRLAGNDHAVGFDLVRRAEAAGAHVLILTMDVP